MGIEPATSLPASRDFGYQPRASRSNNEGYSVKIVDSGLLVDSFSINATIKPPSENLLTHKHKVY